MPPHWLRFHDETKWVSLSLGFTVGCIASAVTLGGVLLLAKMQKHRNAHNTTSEGRWKWTCAWYCLLCGCMVGAVTFALFSSGFAWDLYGMIGVLVGFSCGGLNFLRFLDVLLVKLQKMHDSSRGATKAKAADVIESSTLPKFGSGSTLSPDEPTPLPVILPDVDAVELVVATVKTLEDRDANQFVQPPCRPQTGRRVTFS